METTKKTVKGTKAKRRKNEDDEKKIDIKAQLPPDNLIKEREKGSIYINETQLSEKIINQFYKFYKRKIKRADFYSLLFCGGVLIGVGINYLIKGNDNLFGVVFNSAFNIFLILLGLYLFYYAFSYQKYNKKESLRIYDEDISTYINYYYFNSERVFISNKLGTTERTYDCLEGIYETKKYYYLLISRSSGYIIDKKGFKKGTEEGFHEFIKNKMKKNYKKRCHRKKLQK